MASRCSYKIISRNLNDNINLLFSSKNTHNPVHQNASATSHHISSLVYVSKCNYCDNVQVQNSDGGDKLKIKTKGLIEENDLNVTNFNLENVKEMKLPPISSKINKVANINEWTMNKVAGRPMTSNITNAPMIRSSLPYISQMNSAIIKSNNKELANKLLKLERSISETNIVLESKPVIDTAKSYESPQQDNKNLINSDNVKSNVSSTNISNVSRNLSNILKNPKPLSSAHKWNNLNSNKQILSYNKFKASKQSENQYKPSKSVNKDIILPEKDEKTNSTDTQETKTAKCTKIGNKILIKDEDVEVKTSNPKTTQYKLNKKLAVELGQKKLIKKNFNNVNKEQAYVHKSLINIKKLANQEETINMSVEKNQEEQNNTTSKQHTRDKNLEINLNNKSNKTTKQNVQQNASLMPKIVKRISTDHKVEKFLTYVTIPKQIPEPQTPQRKTYKQHNSAPKQSEITKNSFPNINKNNMDSLKKRINQQSENLSNPNRLPTMSINAITVKENKLKSAKIQEPTILIKSTTPVKISKVKQSKPNDLDRNSAARMTETRNTLKPVESILNIPESKLKKVAPIRKETKQNKVIATTYASKIKMMEKHNRVTNLKFDAKLKLNVTAPYKLHEVESTICINDELMPFKKLQFNSDVPTSAGGVNEKRLIKKGEFSLTKMNFLTEKLVPKRNNMLKASQYHFKASNHTPKITFKTITPSYLSEATKKVFSSHAVNSQKYVKQDATPLKKSNNKKPSGLFEKIYFK